MEIIRRTNLLLVIVTSYTLKLSEENGRNINKDGEISLI